MPEEQLELLPSANSSESAVEEPPESLGPHSPLSAALVEFRVYMQQQGFADNTLRSFLGDMSLLQRFEAADPPLDSFSPARLQQYLDWLRVGRGVPCSPKSFARRLTTLKVFFSWLKESEVLAEDPAVPLVHEPAHAPLPVLLYDDQVGAALSTARDMLWAPHPDARPYLLFSLLLQTGIKKSECMSIRLGHIDTSNSNAPALYIRYEDARRALKERKLALGSGFVPAYRQYVREYEPQVRLFECTARNLEYVLGDLAGAAGIPGGISFEQLRWTSAVRDYRQGLPHETLRLKMGLSPISWRETLPRLIQLASPGL
jgi:site-specific recombinase XerD